MLKKKYLHQPKLSTIRLVEQKLKEKKYFLNRNQLFLSLGKSVMYPTITTILDYLEESDKIAFKKDSSIIWTSQIPERWRNQRIVRNASQDANYLGLITEESWRYQSHVFFCSDAISGSSYSSVLDHCVPERFHLSNVALISYHMINNLMISKFNTHPLLSR